MLIQIFSTGGTIDKVYFDAKDAYAVGEPQIVSILQDAGITADWKLDILFRKDSLEMTDEDRALLARSIRDAEATRILVTHGTDTMVQSAKRLGEVEGKTIVFVGSLTPARFRVSDAVFNIGFAVAAVQTLPPGVYIAMNGRVFAPDKVRKNLELNRFEAVP